MIYYFLAAAAIVAVALVAWIIGAKNRNTDNRKRPGTLEWFFTPEYKRAGTRGEIVAAKAIETILRDGDHLLTNVSIEYEGKPTELDLVIVNRYGVFIFEVKNYNGILIGGENEYEWRKAKTTAAGNVYESTVKNPIKQVKRQIFILSHYLDWYGMRTWIKGYAILLQGNSPVQSEYILTSVADVDRAIHTFDRRGLTPDKVESIIRLLS